MSALSRTVFLFLRLRLKLGSTVLADHALLLSENPRHKKEEFHFWSSSDFGFSISIFRILIFIPGLDGVMTVTKRLPVALIPEELLVSSMRNDVIDVGCLDVLAFLHALYTEGMRLKVTLACSLPCPAVASACC
jgi:hypothetical protein